MILAVASADRSKYDLGSLGGDIEIEVGPIRKEEFPSCFREFCEANFDEINQALRQTIDRLAITPGEPWKPTLLRQLLQTVIQISKGSPG
ncbi:MAG TPA: hypothetical protein VMW75_17935 [Thermoanaerobaculia bacterium]|nr:hypothetical protein [Thermoanaerobaculia bacterium]